MKRLLVFVLCFAMLAVLGCGEKAADDSAVFADGDQYEQIGGELNILNWGEYIDPALIELFEKETGVTVNYVEMTSNEEMLIKLRQGVGRLIRCETDTE